MIMETLEELANLAADIANHGTPEEAKEAMQDIAAKLFELIERGSPDERT